MSSLEIGVLIFFSLWLLSSIWFALVSNGRFRRIESMLGRSGWFHKWRMFVPDVGKISGGFIISYRDQTFEGETGNWTVFEGKLPWSPWISLINPQIRLSAIIRQAAASFGSMRYTGREAEDSPYYQFFLSIMLQYELSDDVSKRQIRVVQVKEEGEFVVMESEYISIE